MQKTTSLFVASILTVACASGPALAGQAKTDKSQTSAGKKMNTGASQESEYPFACSVTALNAAERVRHSELSKTLHASVKEIRELKEGYAFRLSGERETLAMAAEWISLERLCCPFFTFQLEIGSEGNPIWLRLTGREGVKQFMRSEFGIK